MADIPVPMPEKLNLSTKIAYGIGDLGPVLTANVLAFFLLFFLTNVAGMSAGLAGMVLVIGKVWDAVNDLIVGVLSDRTHSRWGRRYPWMIAGAIPFSILNVLHWMVPHFTSDLIANQVALFVYYVVTGICFNTAYTAVTLPYTALTPELAQDYHDRTSLNSVRFAFSIGGGMLSLLLANFIFAIVADQEQRYFVLALTCSILAIPALLWGVWGTRRRAATFRTTAVTESPPLMKQVQIALRNRPFLIVIGIYLCSWLAMQQTAAIFPYFVVNWMGLKEQNFIQFLLTVQVTALVMQFVWGAVSQRVGKKVVYVIGLVPWIIAHIGFLFVQPGQMSLMYLLSIMAGMGVAVVYLVPWSMIPDVIDLEELRTGQRREGVFYAFMIFLQKIGLGIGLFVVGLSLDQAGFRSTIPGQPLPVQPASALLGIRLVIGLLPAIALMGGLVLAYFYPITRAAHTEILLELQERKAQS